MLIRGRALLYCFLFLSYSFLGPLLSLPKILFLPIPYTHQFAISFNSPHVYCGFCFRNVPPLLSNPTIFFLIFNYFFQESFYDFQSHFDGKNVKQHFQLLFRFTILNSQHLSTLIHSTNTCCRHNHQPQEYRDKSDMALSLRELPV